METEIAFNLYDGVFWLSVIVGIMGLAIIGAVVWFGTNVFQRDRREFDYYIHRIVREVEMHRSNYNWNNDVKAWINSISDYRERRNEYWSLYGQIVLSVLVVIILFILLLTKTISAEAGLPILSAVSGFAIAKGINSNPKNDSPNEPNPDQRPD